MIAKCRSTAPLVFKSFWYSENDFKSHVKVSISSIELDMSDKNFFSFSVID